MNKVKIMLKNKREKICDLVRYYLSLFAMKCFLGEARKVWEKEYEKTLQQSKDYQNLHVQMKEHERLFQEVLKENSIFKTAYLKLYHLAQEGEIDQIKIELEKLHGVINEKSTNS